MNIIESIGRTPLLKLKGMTNANIFVKCEGRNPGASIKDRISAAMILDAERRGILTRDGGQSIVEPTSGNTGIGLAFVAAALGYRAILTMPETMSVERQNLLKAYGAQLILTPGPLGMKGAIAEAERIVQGDPGKYFMPMQFENPANPSIHLNTTGPEISEAVGDPIDLFVAGVGTGGTFSGCSEVFKSNHSAVRCVAVEPAESQAIAAAMANQTFKPSPHGIQGIGAGFVPKNLNMSLIDEVACVSTAEAKEFALRLMREEGISSGISGGANVAVAVRLAQSGKYRNIVTVIPDGVDKYMSLLAFRDV